MLPMIFRKVDLSFEKLGHMSWRFNAITAAADWVKWILKTMFELMLAKMTQT